MPFKNFRFFLSIAFTQFNISITGDDEISVKYCKFDVNIFTIFLISEHFKNIYKITIIFNNGNLLSGIRVSVKFHIIYLTPRTTYFKQIHTNHQFWNENVKKDKLSFTSQKRI